ncbi:hypothetical protein [Yunchengibacter salinarum]|uniref:hypothetical protein n=1 Tax=Yunchengibacter salinarum TaxID=3133399 RepID=UPI0035B574B5
MTQLSLPLGLRHSRVPPGFMVGARRLRRDGRLLAQVLSETRERSARHLVPVTALGLGLGAGRIRLDDLLMPWPTADIETRVQSFLDTAAAPYESADHRHLKLYGMLIALSIGAMRGGLEVSMCRGGTRLVPDVLAETAEHGLVAVEGGASAPDKVTALLARGVDHVIVLPFRTLCQPALRGYVFRHRGTAPLPALGHVRADCAARVDRVFTPASEVVHDVA